MEQSEKDTEILQVEKDKAVLKTRTRTPIKAHRTGISKIRRSWLAFVNLLTCCLPTFLLQRFMKNSAVQVAFREKLVLNLLILLLSGLFIFIIVGVGLLICPYKNLLSEYEVASLSSSSKPLVSAYGYYYAIPDVVQNHVVESGYLNLGAMQATTLGRDVSAMFVKTDFFSEYCPGLPKPPDGWDNIVREVPAEAITVWSIHNTKTVEGKFKNFLQMIKGDIKGTLAKDSLWVSNYIREDPITHFVLTAYDRIYDVSQYMNTVQIAQFLGPNIRQIITTQGQSGIDASKLLDQVKAKEGVEKWRRYMNCMDAMFFVGVVDHRQSVGCILSSYLILSASILIVVIIGFKFFAALQFNAHGIPETQKKFVIISVPCYNEGYDSLSNTFASIVKTAYDPERKLLFVVVDGIVKGSENDKFTSDIVLDILGHDSSMQPTRMYPSLGEGASQLNFSKVYSGLYLKMPYVVLVKTGELQRSGNRGKRDSQLILMKFLSHIHSKALLNPLELEILFHFHHRHQIDPRNYEFLLWVDGDTELSSDSILRFVAAMSNDEHISGICGETLLMNESQSWVSMIQVYEYFITHNLSKAFESLVGSVTCLPGCFSMYRIYTADGSPILSSSKLIEEYGKKNINTLHLKNLLSLGEDRYLTTLILKHFPAMRTKFTSYAKAKTSVPAQWSVLLSQRRRWINSTVHNLVELVMLKELPGFFIFSIRFVILIDLLSTLLSPIGFIYFIYLLVTLFTQDIIQFPLVSIILLVAIYGVQVLLFLIKREWSHIGWMLLYLLAMPLYSFVLPLYSFWHFDDFSWGETRKVQKSDEEGYVIEEIEDEEVASVALKSWSEYEATELQWRLEYGRG